MHRPISYCNLIKKNVLLAGFLTNITHIKYFRLILAAVSEFLTENFCGSGSLQADSMHGEPRETAWKTMNLEKSQLIELF